MSPTIPLLDVPEEEPRTSPARIAELKKIYDEEQAGPQKLAIDRDDLPLSYDSIQPGWFTANLAQGHPDAKVEKILLGPADDGTANRRHIRLQWNHAGQEANLPVSVFCKASMGLVNRLNMSWGGLQTEVKFFQVLRKQVDIEAPEAYFSKLDERSCNSITVLKDLTGLVDFCTYRQPSTRPRLEDQIQTLARLHARFYMSTDPDITGLVSFQAGFEGACRSINYEKAAKAGFAACKEVIPARLWNRRADVWPATVFAAKRNARLPYTFCQGDPHGGNWYITKSGKMGLTDYQCSSRGTQWRDIVYLIAAAPEVEDRRAWMPDLLPIYLEAFKQAGGPRIDPDEAWFEMRIQSFSAMVYWTMTASPSEEMPQDMQSFDTSLEFVKRLATFVDDVDAMAAYEQAAGLV